MLWLYLQFPDILWTGLNPQHKGSGPSWCCLGRCGIEFEAKGSLAGEGGYVNSNKRIGLCLANYRWAVKQPDLGKEFPTFSCAKGWAVTKEDVLSGKVKLPTGAAGIMNYGDTSGHTFSVSKVIYVKGQATEIETRECNISDMMGRRKRKINSPALKWFIISPELLVNADYNGISGNDVKVSGATEKTK